MLLILATLVVLTVLFIACIAGALAACVGGVGGVGGGVGGAAGLGVLGGSAAALPPELGDLPADIRKMVALNYKPRGLQANPEFLRAVGSSPALCEIERAISAGCVKEPSLYAQSRADVVDGYAVRVFPKGCHIYKTFLGFVTEEQVMDFAQKNPNRPSWCGDKYLTYAIARTDWGSIVSYRLEQDLVLFDYFNVANLERLVAEIEELKDEFPSGRPAKDVITTLRHATGFGLEPADHIRSLVETYPYWSSVWYYTDPALPQNTATHCSPRHVAGLNPIGAVKNVHATDLAIFDVVLSRHPAIDGLVRDAIRSRLDESGVYYHEEYLVKGSAQTSKLRFDSDDPVCWTRWEIEGFTPPPKGLHLDYTVRKFSSSNRVAANYRFALAKFYSNNDTPLRDLPSVRDLPQRPHVLSYNVHGFISLNADAPLGKTRSNVAALLQQYAPAVEFVVLTEVEISGQKLRGLLAEAGYPHHVSAPNGAPDRSALIVVAAKRPLAGVEIIVTDLPAIQLVRTVSRPTNRKQILFTTLEGLRGVALHLTIGRRYLAGDEGANEERRAENAVLRTKQLATILEHHPDFLIGDFNFTLNDPECRFLADRGYVPANDDHENSTPYNRVDHCFMRKELAGELPPDSNVLLRCNYSDHLPMLQALPWGAANAVNAASAASAVSAASAASAVP